MSSLDDFDSFTPQASVIGAILLKPEIMGEVMLTLNDDDFEDKRCRLVWQAMVGMFREGKTVDIILLREKLSGFGDYADFMLTCMERSPNLYAGEFRHHVEALKRKATLNRLKDIGNQLADASDLDEALSLLAKGNDMSIRSASRERRDMTAMMQSFGERHSSKVAPDRLLWPFNPLNEGLNVTTGKYVILGGYPSDGKTAFALNSALVQARSGKKIGFYSFETDANTVEDRVMASIARIDMKRIQRNAITDGEWDRYAVRSDASSWPFDVISASGMTVDDIRADALAHRYHSIYIDYLQLVSLSRDARYNSRVDEVTKLSIQLQQMAKTTGINVAALSQLSRPERRNGKIPPPDMHSLRESGQIEQDADVVMLIWREDVNDVRAERFLKVAKNKEGVTGSWTLAFDGARQRFGWDTTLSVDTAERWPEKRNPLRPVGQESGGPEPTEIPGQLEMLPNDTPVPF